MISHVYTGVTDFERALRFYTPLMEALGQQLRFSDPSKPWAAWMTPGPVRPLFIIGHPYDGQAHTVGNGQMTALLAPSRDAVDQVHALALSLGGVCEGEPGLRPQYHANFYGAYLRDPDGNKLCVCCHH